MSRRITALDVILSYLETQLADPALSRETKIYLSNQYTIRVAQKRALQGTKPVVVVRKPLLRIGGPS